MSEQPNIIFYRINKGVPIYIRQGFRDRQWMEETRDKYAYRCLPLTIANQNGYEIATTKQIKIIWNGGIDTNDIYIESGVPNIVSSHFGYGVVTFHPNLLIRTPENVNMQVSGIPNAPKRGIAPLSGIVETDWNPASFTMNWKMTEPYKEVIFEPFEPFCFVTPVERSYTEKFRAVIRPLEGNLEEEKNFREWADSRSAFNSDLEKKEAIGWQKHYFQGIYQNGTKCPVDHQTKIKLKEPKIEE